MVMSLNEKLGWSAIGRETDQDQNLLKIFNHLDQELFPCIGLASLLTGSVESSICLWELG
jgi:hypothetical protein